MPELDDKLSRILELARHGVGGEKENAITILKRICAEREISFEDVMRADDIREYRLPYKRGELKIMWHILARYASKQTGNYWPRLRLIQINMTPGEYVELTYLVAQYLEAYKKERSKIVKSIPGAFIRKHNLYRESSPDDKPSKPLTYAQWKQLEMEEAMSGGMANVEITKGIESGLNK